MKKKRKAPDNAQYDVGYCRPPKAGQFRKGVSGHKEGRGKGRKNFATLLHEALSEHVTVAENGISRRMSKLEIMFKQLANQGAAGDLRAFAMILQRIDATQAKSESDQTEVLDEAETEVARALVERIRSARKETSDD